MDLDWLIIEGEHKKSRHTSTVTPMDLELEIVSKVSNTVKMFVA